MQRFAKRWYRRRALRIFRDDGNLENNEALWGSLAQALDASDHLILLASPASARSPWIPREVRHWRAAHPGGRLLVVLTGGEIEQGAGAETYDWDRTTALPRDLADEFAGGPRYTDLRWAHAAHDLSLADRRALEDVADLAAPLHGSTKEDMISRDAAEHRRTKRTIAGVGVVLAGLAATATVFGVLAEAARHRAEAEARVALARQLAAQSRVAINEDRPDLGLLLAVQAGRTDTTRESRDALLAALKAAPQVIRVWSTPPARLAAATADAASMTLLGRDGVVRRLAVGSGRVTARFEVGRGGATGLAAGDDGRLVAVGGRGGALSLVDLRRRRRTVLVRGRRTAGGTVASDAVNHPAFAARRPVLVWDAGQRVGVWTGGVVRMLQAPYSPEDVPWKPAVSKDGLRVAAVGGEVARIAVWRLDARGRPRGAARMLPAQAGVEGLGTRDVITALAFSATDDSLLAVARSDGAVALVDVDAGRTVRILRGGRGRVEHVAFAPDGRRLVAAHEGGVDAWDVATGRRRPGRASAFSSDLAVGLQPGRGPAIAAGSAGTVAVIDVERPRQRLARPLLGVRGTVDTVVASPDGRTVLASSFAGDPQLLAPGASTMRPLPLRGADVVLRPSADGRHVLACCGEDFESSVLRVVDLDGRKARSLTDDDERTVADAALARSGGLVALGLDDGGDPVAWDPRRPGAVRRLAGARGGEATALSSDGRWAAVVVDGRTGVWGTRDGRRRGPPIAGRPVAFSPDGRRLAVAEEGAVGGAVRVVAAATGRPVAGAMETRQPVASGAFSPDGRTLALLTGSSSLTARAKAYAVELWDAARATKVGTEDLVTWSAAPRSRLTPSVAFRSSGSEGADVVVGGLVSQPLEWTLDLAAWRRAACAVVRRDLTRAEWDAYVGGVAPYRPTCTSA